MRALGAVLASLWVAPSALAQQTHLVVVSGLSGESGYAETFHEWATALCSSAHERWGLPPSNIVYLAEDPSRDVNRITAKSTRENIQGALAELAERADPNDQIFIVLIGHGSTRDGEARLNLPGPDMSASEFEKSLAAFPTQKIVFVNAASASGDFVAALSGENRTVITATKSGHERNETIFPRFFVEAYTSDGADTDKDERVSALEAFNYARREVARVYESEGRLLTEHALLDDNADGEGSNLPDARGGSDGTLARTIFLTGGPSALTDVATPADPALVALYGEKQALEQAIAELRQRKDDLDTATYEAELERLLVDLALKTREIRSLEERRQ